MTAAHSLLPPHDALAREVRAGLSAPRKSLPAALLYDALGSALFEAITLVPEYEVARADTRLLLAHRHDVAALLGGPLEVVELGPGAGAKAARFLEALTARQAVVRYAGVDVSAKALADCRLTLAPLEGVDFTAIQDSYLEGLERAVRQRAPGVRVLVLFLGSNISNFSRDDAQDFLAAVRRALAPGDGLLLAADLDKPPAVLLPAYDDALGVTAAFNRNVLVRLNREYGGDFVLERFAHQARWDARERRVEMHLQALIGHTVRLPRLGLTLTFAAGESIWTESSHRFTREELSSWGESAGFGVVAQWVDARWALAHTLYLARRP